MSSNTAWTKVGSLRKGKNGNLYIKVDNDVALKMGDALSLQDPRKKIDAAVEAKKFTEEEGETKKAKIPEFIKYDVFVIPEKD
jgi:hypothetical protein